MLEAGGGAATGRSPRQREVRRAAERDAACAVAPACEIATSIITNKLQQYEIILTDKKTFRDTHRVQGLDNLVSRRPGHSASSILTHAAHGHAISADFLLADGRKP